MEIVGFMTPVVMDLEKSGRLKLHNSENYSRIFLSWRRETNFKGRGSKLSF